MSATAINTSSLPAELLATNTHDALARHIFPPFYPSPVNFELNKGKPTALWTTSTSGNQRRSPGGHASPPTQSSSMSSSHATTATTFKLFEIHGDFSYDEPHVLSLTLSFIFNSTPPGDIVDVLRQAQLPPSSPHVFLTEWNVLMTLHEKNVWRPLTRPAAKVPSYTSRARGDLGGHDGIASVELRDRPANEHELTSHFLKYIGDLVELVFDPAHLVLDPEVVSKLMSTIWGEQRGVGSRTADMGMRKPLALSDDDWALFLSFIGKFKLMPEQDIAALVEASKRSNVGGGRAACQALSDASPQGSPEAGFTLTLNKEGLFETDADNLPDVWLRVLPQLVEEFSANHAERIIFGNWDHFVLFKLINKHTASISSIFYRDPALHPQADTYQPGTPNNPILIEVIIAAMLSTRMATDASLWRDLARVSATLQADRLERSPVADNPVAKRAKPNNAQSGAKGIHPKSRADDADDGDSPLCCVEEWERGVYAQHDGPTFGDQWVMVAPDTVHELVHRLRQLDRDVVLDETTEASTPPLIGTPTHSPPSSPPQASPDGLSTEPISLIMDWYLGSGRMYDVYAGLISVGNMVQDVALKYLNLATFYNERDCGGEQLVALDNELDMLARAAEAVPGIAPRLLGVWTCGKYSQEYIVAVEDCGNRADLHTVADEVRAAYKDLHAHGLCHGDVEPRHILRDVSGRVRIVDWEAGYVGDEPMCQNEQDKVEAMRKTRARK